MPSTQDGVEWFYFEIFQYNELIKNKNSHHIIRYMAKWTCYFPRPWHGNKCLRTCNGKQLEAYCECGKAVRGAKVDSDCGWVGIVSSMHVIPL